MTQEAIEHLKLMVQTILGTYHDGSGIVDGKPERITLDIATRMIWIEIDKTLSSEQKIPSDQIRLRLFKKDSCFEELNNIISICGDWIIRSNIENNVITAYIVGKLKENTNLSAVLSFLRKRGWEVTDLSIGV